MIDETYLEDKDLSEKEKNVIRMLYYENRIMLEDVADILGSMDAMRSYILKDGLEVELDSIPEPADVEIPSDKEFYDEEIPDEVLDEVLDEVTEEK